MWKSTERCRREREGKREVKNLCWHLVCMIIWSVYDGSEFERHFVQLEVCSKFPPAPDRDEVALSEDAVAPSQQRVPKHCKWSKQKLMSITSHTCLTQDDIEWIFPQFNCFILSFNYSNVKPQQRLNESSLSRGEDEVFVPTVIRNVHISEFLQTFISLVLLTCYFPKVLNQASQISFRMAENTGKNTKKSPSCQDYTYSFSLVQKILKIWYYTFKSWTTSQETPPTSPKSQFVVCEPGDWLPNYLWCHKSCSWTRLSQTGFSVRAEKLPLSAGECEHTLLVSNSEHTSFSTAKLKHSTVGTRRQNTFLRGGGL